MESHCISWRNFAFYGIAHFNKQDGKTHVHSNDYRWTLTFFTTDLMPYIPIYSQTIRSCYIHQLLTPVGKGFVSLLHICK